MTIIINERAYNDKHRWSHKHKLAKLNRNKKPSLISHKHLVAESKLRTKYNAKRNQTMIQPKTDYINSKADKHAPSFIVFQKYPIQGDTNKLQSLHSIQTTTETFRKGKRFKSRSVAINQVDES